MEKASGLGLRTLALSEKNGGAGADALTSCIVTEELAVGDVGISATLGQTSALARLWLDRVMTPEQRERFLPRFLADHRYHLATAGHDPTPIWLVLSPAADHRRATRPLRCARRTVTGSSWRQELHHQRAIAKLIAVHVRAKSAVARCSADFAPGEAARRG
jgi:hypothetical protein